MSALTNNLKHQSGEPVESIKISSPIYKSSPVLDYDGEFRMDGRLANSEMSAFDKKYPINLVDPRNHAEVDSALPRRVWARQFENHIQRDEAAAPGSGVTADGTNMRMVQSQQVTAEIIENVSPCEQCTWKSCTALPQNRVEWPSFVSIASLTNQIKLFPIMPLAYGERTTRCSNQECVEAVSCPTTAWHLITPGTPNISDACTRRRMKIDR